MNRNVSTVCIRTIYTRSKKIVKIGIWLYFSYPHAQECFALGGFPSKLGGGLSVTTLQESYEGNPYFEIVLANNENFILRVAFQYGGNKVYLITGNTWREVGA